MNRLIISQSTQRRRLPFSAVNRRGSPAYQFGMQRHHLLPRQLLSQRFLKRLLKAVKVRTLGFDDFRRNGLLLPCEEAVAARLGLPLHRGPHREYNEMVVAQIGAIESEWAFRRQRGPKLATIAARLRLASLQRELKHSLLSANPPKLVLDENEKLGNRFEFADLDAMAAQLWSATQSAVNISSFAKNSDRAE